MKYSSKEAVELIEKNWIIEIWETKWTTYHDQLFRDELFLTIKELWYNILELNNTLELTELEYNWNNFEFKWNSNEDLINFEELIIWNREKTLLLIRLYEYIWIKNEKLWRLFMDYLFWLLSYRKSIKILLTTFRDFTNTWFVENRKAFKY